MEGQGHENLEGIEVPPDDTLLRNGLADVFEQARAEVADWLEKEGVPPVMPSWQMVIDENEGGTGWSGHHVEVNENVLRHGLVEVHMASQKVLAEWAPTALEIAEGLQKRFSKTRPQPFPFRPRGLDVIGVDETSLDVSAGEATDMMIEFVFAPTCWYLDELPSVADPDAALATAVADQVVNLLASGDFIIRQSVALAGLTTDEDLEDGLARLAAFPVRKRPLRRCPARSFSSDGSSRRRHRFRRTLARLGDRQAFSRYQGGKRRNAAVFDHGLLSFIRSLLSARAWSCLADHRVVRARHLWKTHRHATANRRA